MCFRAILHEYADTSEMVAVCDINEGRMNMAVEEAKNAGVEIKGYPAHQFDRMIAETKPDTVIVTTKDSYHDKYIVRAMELGCDVITEKPMTTDAEKCQRIVDTQREIGRASCRERV